MASHGYDDKGLPILSVKEKLDVLSACVAGGHTEVALGQLGDLFEHFRRELNTEKNDSGLRTMTKEEAVDRFLGNPTPVIGPNALDRMVKALDQIKEI